MTGATNQPLVSRHQATWWRWVERCGGVHREPNVWGWRKLGRGGHGRQLERIKSWMSNLRLRAPRRKSGWTASRSPHTEAPLLLLLQVHQAILHLILLLLHLLDTLINPNREDIRVFPQKSRQPTEAPGVVADFHVAGGLPVDKSGQSIKTTEVFSSPCWRSLDGLRAFVEVL